MTRELYSARRAYNTGGLTRFRTTPVTEPVARAIASIRSDHPALSENRTLYPSSVHEPVDRDRVLISGMNNAKIGRHVTKGPWAGMPIFTLSLEERATCPSSCPVLSACYGNGMPLAARFKHGPALMMSLDGELDGLAHRFPRGFVVRLHVLGDFPDLEYLTRWMIWSDTIKALHIWGYTAHGRETPIGRRIRQMNGARSERWQIRFSVAPEAPYAPMQAAAIWTKPAHTNLHDEAIVCPQELGKTQACASCALCWNPAAAHIRILFLGHGGRPGTTNNN